MRQRLRLKAPRKNGFSATVSARALNVASLSSLMDLDHQPGMRPQRARINSRLPSSATIASMVVVGQTLKRGRKLCCAGPSVSRYSATISSQVSLKVARALGSCHSFPLCSQGAYLALEAPMPRPMLDGLHALSATGAFRILGYI